MAEPIKINEKRDIRYYLDRETIDTFHAEAMRAGLSASAFLRVIRRILKEPRWQDNLRKRIDEIIIEESRRV